MRRDLETQISEKASRNTAGLPKNSYELFEIQPQPFQRRDLLVLEKGVPTLRLPPCKSLQTALANSSLLEKWW